MFPFRLGTTSYIVPADLVANARFLSGKVQDVQLVLFDIDDGPSNLPSPETTRQLAGIAASINLTFTVHLPLDVRLGDNGETDHVSMLKAKKVIDCTRELEPFAYVTHLDGRAVKGGATPAQLAHWQDRSVKALDILAGWASGAEKLAVENLDSYPPGFFLPVIERAPVSRCVDVGHLWLDGHDPLPHLQAALPRTRVIHIHGLAPDGRDHASLAHMPPEKLDPVMELLVRENYSSVLTLEVFGDEDFLSSAAAIENSGKRIHHEGAKTRSHEA
ncbi:MAG: cobamide remodeling phosphodiesterase CbiR [Chloroflexota bacterium]